MAYKITDSCLKCGTCAGECPMNAISEGEDQYVIDADTCVGCGDFVIVINADKAAAPVQMLAPFRLLSRSKTILHDYIRHTAEPFRRMLHGSSCGTA